IVEGRLPAFAGTHLIEPDQPRRIAGKRSARAGVPGSIPENVKEAAAGSCVNSRFRLPRGRRPVWVRLHCPPFASEAGAVFPDPTDVRSVARSAAAWLPNGVTANGDRHGQVVQCPEGFRFYSADKWRS